jgi:UDP-N-acetylglucosamine--N-acetylmuramyl-(pentapeptide) pyrophosphoryl-undecaprenol N-acetylglucosamine transferase
MSTGARYCIVVMAGGTGGHVFPALAVAERLRALGHEVVWIGTRAGLEARVVPARGLPIEWITIAGVRGKGLMTLLLAPLNLLRAVWQALAILRRRRPQAVIGLGGFVAGPGGLAAWLLRRPLLIHEQNAIAGLTNRLLAHLARRVLEAFPDTFPASARRLTVGNPVRPEITALPPPAQRLAKRDGRARLLVLGGSLGALALNRSVPQALALLPPELRPEVRHQAGRTLAEAQKAYAAAGLDIQPEAFIEDMAAAYAWADLVICRAGALTVAELAAAGLPAVLIPFPYAVDDHQTANAQYLVSAGAARLIQERELTPQVLCDLLRPLLGDAALRLRMAEAARARAWPQACERIADECLALAGGAA